MTAQWREHAYPLVSLKGKRTTYCGKRLERALSESEESWRARADSFGTTSTWMARCIACRKAVIEQGHQVIEMNANPDEPVVIIPLPEVLAGTRPEPKRRAPKKSKREQDAARAAAATLSAADLRALLDAAEQRERIAVSGSEK